MTDLGRRPSATQSRPWRVPEPTLRNRRTCTWQRQLQEQAGVSIDDSSQLRWFCASPAMLAFTPLALATSVRSTAYGNGLAASCETSLSDNYFRFFPPKKGLAADCLIHAAN